MRWRVAGRGDPRLRLVVVGGGRAGGASWTPLAGHVGITSGRGSRASAATSPTPARAHVSCLSSVHEGVPMMLLGSPWRPGGPVVATACGAVRDLVEDGVQGFVVPVRDAAALADRLGRLADDVGLRRRLGAAGRARAEREFGIDRTARAYEELMTELVVRV